MPEYINSEDLAISRELFDNKRKPPIATRVPAAVADKEVTTVTVTVTHQGGNSIRKSS